MKSLNLESNFLPNSQRVNLLIQVVQQLTFPAMLLNLWDNYPNFSKGEIKAGGNTKTSLWWLEVFWRLANVVQIPFPIGEILWLLSTFSWSSKQWFCEKLNLQRNTQTICQTSFIMHFSYCKWQSSGRNSRWKNRKLLLKTLKCHPWHQFEGKNKIRSYNKIIEVTFHFQD